MSFIHIVGAGRGGTSLLAGVVDAHPACEIVFETLSVSNLMADGSDPSETLELRTKSRVLRFLAACEQEASRSRLAWGHKTTTEHIWALAEMPADSSTTEFDPIDYFAHHTAAMPTLYVVRDGRTCIPSKMRRTGMSLELAIARWRFSIEYLKRLRQANALLHVVRMEDLVSNPTGATAGICDFLGLPVAAEMLDGTRNDKMLPEYRRGTFDAGTTRRPAKEPWWTRLINDDLAYCGYEVDAS